MEKKLMISFIVVISAIILISVYLNTIHQTPKKHPTPTSISYEGKLVQTSSEYIGAYIKLETNETIYYCVINVSYLANNGTWVKLTRNIGTVDGTRGEFPFELMDCQEVSGLKYNTMFPFDDSDDLGVIKIETEGYSLSSFKK